MYSSSSAAVSAATVLWLALASLPAAGQVAFDVIVAAPHVGASLSANGERVSIASADESGQAGVPGLFTVSGTAGVSIPVISGDGSIIQGIVREEADELYEYRNGSLSFVPGPRTYTPLALNYDGSVSVGQSAIGSAPSRTLGGVGGGVELLGDLPGGTTSGIAWDVSGDGNVIVGSASSSAGKQAFRWEGGTMVGLGDLPGGGFSSEAFGISLDGTTIVGSGTTVMGTDAFRWRDGTMSVLGELPGGSSSSAALGVSGDGSIVVGRTIGSDSRRRAFIWDEVNGMRDLEQVLTGHGIDLTGFELYDVTGISSDGRRLVGTGRNSLIGDDNFGLPLAWVATVPEPTTAILLGLGLACLSGRGRNRV